MTRHDFSDSFPSDPTDAAGEPIPHIDTANDPITGTEDLRQRWRALMGPLGFSEALLWCVFIDDDGRIRPALPRFELTAHPEPDYVDAIVEMLGSLVDDLGSVTVACLLTRPGNDGVSVGDLGWMRLITDAARRHRLPLRPFHRANDVTLITLDDLIDAVA